MHRIWPAVLLLYVTLIPPEVAFFAGSFRFGAYRIVLFLLIPWLFTQFAKGRIKLGLIDIAMLVVTLWLPLSFAQNYNIAVGIEAGGSQTVDMMLAYLIGRGSIRSLTDFRNLLRLVFPGLLVAGLLLMLESVGGRLFVREAFQAAFGAADEVGGEIKHEFRYGFLRAQGPFSHPIHAGMYLTAYVPLFFMTFRAKIWRFGGLIPGVLGVFSLSSTGVLGLVLSIGLIGYDWFQKRVKEIGWIVAVTALSVGLFVIHLVSNSGLISVIYRYLTFNPKTGWFRTQIWYYSIDDIWAHPWFGIGYEAYTRPSWFVSDSIDAHYLAMAVKYGVIPALTYLMVAIVIVIMLAARARQSAATSQRDSFVGMAICLVTIVTILFTVAIWGAMLTWFNFLLGVFVSMIRNPANYNRQLGAG
ncbi:MAG: O-antigen ligase family protein [Sphingorhabdus sp.]